MNEERRNNEDDLYLEIWDLVDDSKKIRFPAYRNSFYAQRSENEKIPLSTFYYSALQLTGSIKDFRSFERIDRIIENAEKIWFICSFENKELVDEYMDFVSLYIKNIINKPRESNDSFDNYDDFEQREMILSGKLLESFYIWLNQGNNEEIYTQFKERSGPCVAIAMPTSHNLRDEKNCYLALSGVFNDYEDSTLLFEVDDEMKTAYESINSLLKKCFGNEFVKCHLKDVTRRYTEYTTKDDFEHRDFDGRVLSEPETFINDFSKYYTDDKDLLWRHYSCCEKKIIAHMNFVNKSYAELLSGRRVVNLLSSYEFRIRQRPCRMCRPALIGCYHILYDVRDLLGLFCLDGPWHRVVLDESSNPKQPLKIL